MTNLKTKTDKACFIASILFQKPVTVTNWKVRDLVKKKIVELDELVIMAKKAQESRFTLIVKS